MKYDERTAEAAPYSRRTPAPSDSGPDPSGPGCSALFASADFTEVGDGKDREGGPSFQVPTQAPKRLVPAILPHLSEFLRIAESRFATMEAKADAAAALGFRLGTIFRDAEPAAVRTFIEGLTFPFAVTDSLPDLLHTDDPRYRRAR